LKCKSNEQKKDTIVIKVTSEDGVDVTQNEDNEILEKEPDTSKDSFDPDDENPDTAKAKDHGGKVRRTSIIKMPSKFDDGAKGYSGGRKMSEGALQFANRNRKISFVTTVSFVVIYLTIYGEILTILSKITL